MRHFVLRGTFQGDQRWLPISSLHFTHHGRHQPMASARDNQQAVVVEFPPLTLSRPKFQANAKREFRAWAVGPHFWGQQTTQRMHGQSITDLYDHAGGSPKRNEKPPNDCNRAARTHAVCPYAQPAPKVWLRANQIQISSPSFPPPGPSAFKNKPS